MSHASKRRWCSPYVDKRRSSSVATGRVSPPLRTPRLALTNRARTPITRIVNAAEIPAPQLGRILIAAGLLSEEQLAQALEEQAQTGRRLGEIIVQRGFISGPALANALAEQHGGVLKTEYGFASGLGGVVARRAASESGTSVSPIRPPDPTPLPLLRTAEPQAESHAPEDEQAPAASEEATEPPLRQQSPDPVAPAEPALEPEQTLEPPPLLRPAEPPAPVVEEPSELEPRPAAVTPLSPPESTTPVPQTTPAAEVQEPSLEPTTLRSTAPPSAEEAPLATEPAPPPPVEPEPRPPAEAAEPLTEPVEFHLPAPEPPPEAPRPIAPEPMLPAPPEPEPAPSTAAAEPLPEPVELRPEAAEPVQEAPPPAVPEPQVRPPFEPEPPAEAAEPVPEPVEVQPQVPEPEPSLEPEPPLVAGLDDRDQLLESLRARVEAQELELAKLREQLEEERARKEVQVHVWPEEQPAPTTPGPVPTENYLLCVPTAAGYVLLDRVGALPSVGHAVDVPEEEGRFTVTKVVRLPRNGRPCAYLQRA